MGEMADYALECAMDDCEFYWDNEFRSDATKYELGLIDEYGATIGNPSLVPPGSKFAELIFKD